MVILEVGGALEEEVVGRIEDLLILVLYVIIVAKQAILQPSVMLREMIFVVVNCNKETMHRLHDRMKMEKSICLLCSI